MNDFEEISLLQLDRFVDGELSDSDGREVLAAADREPETWRRIALAFVEAQTLRRELSGGDWRAEDVGPPRLLVADSAVSNPPRATPAGLRIAALVVCCVIAFGFGRWSSSFDARMASNPNVPSLSPSTFGTGNRQPQTVAAVFPEDTQQHQTLRLDFDDLLGGPPQSVDVPVVDESQGDPMDLLEGPPLIPPEIQRALLRAGRRVHEHRQLFEVELSDGRRGVVPVSNVLVENSGLGVFQ